MRPFKGHMCTKSSIFCLGSSSKLSTQFIIQDHMAVHYKNLLSTKAAVDTSMPKTMSTSIKYSDQQKRVKLNKAVKKYQKKILHHSSPQMNTTSVSPPTCRIPSAKELTSMKIIKGNPEKSTNIFHGNLSSEQINAQEINLSNVFPLKISKPVSSVNTRPKKTIQDVITSGSSHLIDYGMSNYGRSIIPCNQSVKFIDKPLTNRPFQDPQKKTFCGDILVKHSNWFTEENQCFTPRILKKASKSFLSKYLYYKAPKKRITDKAPVQQCSPTKLDKKMQRSPLAKSVLAWDNELKYLQFLREVTDDILIRGYHSNKILENVFQRHIERNKYHLNEDKLNNILQNLRDELQADPIFSSSEQGFNPL
ncbi:spermatogenesis-associated protein 7 homolog [Rhinoraja longicauda]